MTPQDEEKMLELRSRGWNFEAIGQVVGMTREDVRAWFRTISQRERRRRGY